MWLSSKHQKRLLKLVSLFSVVRGYNIIVLVVAQYFVARYIISIEQSWWDILLDVPLFCIVAASAFASAAGYIINNFYDAAKDQINRPKKYLLEHLISQQLQLILYLLLNMLTLVFASVISFRAVVFFLGYIFAIWLYSGALKKLFWLSNLWSTALMILPFGALSIYYRNFDSFILYYAGYLFFLLLARDIIKDLENFKGDWVQRYQTLPVVFNNRITKGIISLSFLFCLFPIYYLSQRSLGIMNYYFMASIPYLGLLLLLLWRAKNQTGYLWLHNMIKVWVLAGVFSIFLIHKSLINF